MDCRQIEQLLSPYIDGELTRAEAEAVRTHLTACASCDREYESMVRLSTACKYIKQVIVPAPSGFKDTLMLRIANDEKPIAPINSPGWFNRNWKQIAAGIAAGVLLVIGTLSMHSGPVLQVAQNPPAITEPGDNPQPADSSGDTAVNNNNDNSSNTQSPGVTQNPADEPTVSTGGDTTPSTYSPSTLMNKNRFITSTMLRIKATHGDDAFQQAMDMAAKANAQTQNLGQQINNNGTFSVLKIIVATDKADELINKLSSLGTVDSKEVNNDDITAQYADKLTQYQALITQRAAVQDSKQEAELDQRIKTIETELKNWEHEANQETIVLWLEK